ncbi:MAG TPA: hypothetical protein VFA20_08025 [Myxococcaceae bacterium]|nr:hypothetical protein [Myxococcaceae bacterium]
MSGWNRRSPQRALAALVAPVAAFAALAARYVRVGALGPDEGFYGMAARLAMRGLVPYRDFAYAQAHGFPYLHGALAEVAGFGLMPQRILCAAYAGAAVVALGAAAQLGRRIDGADLRQRRAGVAPGDALPSGRRAFGLGLAAWAMATSPAWIAKASLVQPCSMSGLFLMGAGAAALWMPEGRRRPWAIAALGGLAVACKLIVLPAALVLWGYEFRRTRSWVAPVAVVAALFVPFIAAAPGPWWFWNLGYHFALEGVDFRAWESYRDHLALAPSVLVVAAAAMRGRGPARVVLAAGVLAWVAQLPLRETHSDNAVPLVPLIALAAGELVAEWNPGLRARGALVAGLLVSFAFRPPPVDPLLFHDLDEAAEVLRKEARPLLTPLPVVALESGRDVLPGLEMGPFCVTSELPEERARALHLWTLPALERELPAAGAVVLTPQASTWDFFWSVPSLRPTPPEQRSSFFGAMRDAGYRKVLQNSQVAIFTR